MNGMNHLKNLAPLGEMLKNKGVSFVHNPALLNLQSLIMASLVLVINRSVIANYSAVKAKDTPDGPYRTHEAYRTTIREFLGFTGGFIVLRQLQGWIKGGVGKALGVTDKENPNNYPLGAAFKKWLENPAEKALPFKPNFTADLTPEVSEKLTAGAKRCIAAAHVFKPSALANRAAIDVYLRLMREILSIGGASIPSVLLAGVGLEIFTRDHADHVADFIGAHFGGSKVDNKKNKSIPAPAAPAPLNAVSVAPKVTPSFGANPALPFNRMNPGVMAANSPWSNQHVNPMPIQPMPVRRPWPSATFN